MSPELSRPIPLPGQRLNSPPGNTHYVLNHVLRTYYLEVKRGSQIKDWETEKVILIFLYAEPHNFE